MSKCRSCNNEHATNITCAEYFATNKPHITATNKADSATNARTETKAEATNTVEETGQGVCGHTGVGIAVVVFPRTANRRTKEAYNAYQREYMRKRRAKPATPAV